VTSGLDQLCPTCGPVEGIVRPNLGFRCSKSSLHTESIFIFNFDHFKFDIFNVRDPQCHFITFVLCVAIFPYVHGHLGAKTFTSFLISILVPLALMLPMESHLRSGLRYQTAVTIAVRIRTLLVH